MQMSNMKNINMLPNADLPLGNFKPGTHNQLNRSVQMYTKTCHIFRNKCQKAGTFGIFYDKLVTPGNEVNPQML